MPTLPIRPSPVPGTLERPLRSETNLCPESVGCGKVALTTDAGRFAPAARQILREVYPHMCEFMESRVFDYEDDLKYFELPAELQAWCRSNTPVSTPVSTSTAVVAEGGGEDKDGPAKLSDTLSSTSEAAVADSDSPLEPDSTPSASGPGDPPTPTRRLDYARQISRRTSTNRGWELEDKRRLSTHSTAGSSTPAEGEVLAGQLGMGLVSGSGGAVARKKRTVTMGVVTTVETAGGEQPRPSNVDTASGGGESAGAEPPPDDARGGGESKGADDDPPSVQGQRSLPNDGDKKGVG
jgi:hypothetical protein